jgi:DHA1 family tetracycline resistance protein-like MFS transporter
MNNINIFSTRWYLILVALLDFMGLGIVVTIFPHLFLDNTSQILPVFWSYNQKLTALGFFLAIYPLGQFFGATVFGKLSDSHGRKKMLVITLLGTAICFFLSGLAIIINSAMTLFLSRFFAGLFAGNIAIAQASMSDISDEHTKAKNLTLIQIALGLAWVIGPPLGGWLSVLSISNMSGFATPFWVMSTLLILVLIYTIVFYKETLSEFKHNKLNLLSNFLEIREAFTDVKLRSAFFVWFVFVAGWWLFEAFLPAYLLQVFNFSSARIGTFLASMGATYALFQFLVVQKVAKKVSPKSMVKYSLIFSALAVIGIAFSKNIILLHILITLFVTTMGFALPGLITSISNLESKENQGKIMGMISSIQAIATVVVMMFGGYLDNSNIALTVIGGGVLLLISWMLFISKFYRLKKQGVQ